MHCLRLPAVRVLSVLSGAPQGLGVEKFAQISPHFSIDQKSVEIWTSQADLQPIPFKSDRRLGNPGQVQRGVLRRSTRNSTNSSVMLNIDMRQVLPLKNPSGERVRLMLTLVALPSCIRQQADGQTGKTARTAATGW